MRFPARSSLRTLAFALVLGAGMLAVRSTAPMPVVAIGPLPDCRIADVLTAPRGYDDWSTTLVDWILSVGPDYKPPDLVSVREGGVSGGGYVRKVAIADLRAMAAAARRHGTPLVAWSPYRSYKQQAKLFAGYASAYGFKKAITFSARPGHSEHHLGVTIDFVAVGDDGLTSNWEVTPTGAWMAKHAWEYGWLMSYPKGKQDVVCYSYEPWHYRYVGRDLARKIHQSGLTIREYLWANFTTADPSANQPISSASASPSGSAFPYPSPEASAGPPASAAPATETGALESPGPTAPAASAAGALFGIDSGVLFASLLVVLASIGIIATLGFLRRSGRTRRRWQ
jgi:D-alanyl-D-alanine carboxypeptidase